MQKQQDVYGNIVKIYQLEMLMMNNTTDSFKFKAKITGQTGNDGTKGFEIIVPLKYLSNFWRTLEIPLINCEVNLILTWSSNCVLIATAIQNQTTTFEITDTKLYVPVVTLSKSKIQILTI